MAWWGELWSGEAGLSETILVTGSTGSFGSAFVRMLLNDPDGPRVRILSRDEHKQNLLAQELPPGPRTTYVICDVRDFSRLRQAADGCTAIVHAAALKTVPGGERHVSEFVRTNVYGTECVINAALEACVPRTLLISSDKAVSPLNLYGATKKVAEALIVQANALGVTRGCAFSVVRGGNVFGSAGSVVPMWRQQIAAGQSLSVTDPDATRFNLLMPDWVSFVWWALGIMRGGEIFCPKPPAWRLGDLAGAMSQGKWVNIIGTRNGDKANESLIAPDEAARTVDVGRAFVIEPDPALRDVWNYRAWTGTRPAPGWAFTSDTACRMSADELIRLVGQP